MKLGIIGTGKIGKVFINICRGFGMKVLAYDKYPVKDAGIDYVPLETLLAQSDIISLHCPLTEETRHLIDENAIKKMKKGVTLINTSRGALIDAGKTVVDGVTTYDFSTAAIFWIGASVVSFVLPIFNWRKKANA